MRTNRQLRWTRRGVTFAALTALLVVSPALAANKLTTVKVATAATDTSFLPLYVGVAQGFYKSAGFNVQIFRVTGGTPGMAAIESGSVQFYAGLPQSAIAPVAAGADVRIICALTTKNDYEILASPSIHSLDQLKGKKVGILVEGNGTQTQQEWLLDKVGVGAHNVTWVAAGGTTSRLAALMAGQVAATILNIPTDLIAQSKGYNVIAKFIDYVPDFSQQVIDAKGSFLKAHPAEVRAFLKATVDASNWIYAHPQEAVQIDEQYTKATPQIAQESLKDMLAMSDYSKTGQVSEPGITWALGVARKYTTEKVPTSAASMLDLTYLPATP